MRKLFIALVVAALLSGAALIALGCIVGLPADGIHVIVNEHELDIARLSGWHAAAAGLAILLALCAAAIVVPLALLLGLLLPLLVVLGVLLLVFGAVLGAGALAIAPLLLPLLLLVWLWRRSRRAKAAPAAGTTIDA